MPHCFCNARLRRWEEKQDQIPVSQFSKPEHFLRLYHAVVDDRIKPSYLMSNDLDGGRMETDGRNSDDRPPGFAELCAKLYNDEWFVPATNIYDTLHGNFAKSIIIHKRDCPDITADKVREHLQTKRCQMMQVVAAWNASGNGEGQLPADHADYGIPTKNSFVNGDNRKSFLLGFKPDVLYFWQLIIDNGCFDYTRAQLKKGFAGSSDKVVTTSYSSAQKRKKKEEDADPIAVMLATKLDGLTKANLRDAINGTVAMIAQRSLEKIRAKDDSEKAQIELLIQPLRDELAQTKRMYDESFDS